jgi:prepilin-type N-terminal cleavage/methylation domain-containing protein/prepilin-type processing-associated H-X9-DG protein
MNKYKAFTLIELLVVVAVIVILLSIMVSALGRAREAERRTVCLSNLKELQLTWIIYAEDNEEKIPAGNVFSAAQHIFENFKKKQTYLCPNRFSGALATYSIVDSMNGIKIGSIINQAVSQRNKVDETVLWITNRLQITKPPPASRMVYIDVGMEISGSFGTYYDVEAWRKTAPCRHIDGNTFSFADGHAEFWKWEGKDTIDKGVSVNPADYTVDSNSVPTTKGGFKDLHRFQKAVWGRLGYTPTPTE